ncbi:MAG TPA: 5-bromo-4-chloroindolyl phosphate hydrolysis family protein [Vicinamibacterales bacterium]
MALIRWARAWAPAVTSAALFLLPIPLGFAAVAALIAGDLNRLALAGGALACIWGAGLLALRGLAGEARYFLGERPDPPAIPLKLLSAGLTALGVAVAAVAGGHTASGALVFAVLGGLGHVSLYGRDLRPPRIQVAIVDGVDAAAVTLQLKHAYGRLRGIDAAAHGITTPEFRERLARITGIGRSILCAIERDPADAARARRFLHLYLDSAERVTTEYARTHSQVRHQPLDQNFRQLLVGMERTFAEQQRALVERNLLSLDVDIEVLNARLTHEGPG